MQRLRRAWAVAGLAAIAGCQSDARRHQASVSPSASVAGVADGFWTSGTAVSVLRRTAAKPVDATEVRPRDVESGEVLPAGRTTITAAGEQSGQERGEIVLAQVSQNAGTGQPEAAPQPGLPSQPLPNPPTPGLPASGASGGELPGLGLPGGGLPEAGLPGGGTRSSRPEGSLLGESAPRADEANLPKLGLRDAVAVSLVQNPDLIVARGQENVSAAVVGVARTYPWNPFVQSQIFPAHGTPYEPGTGPGTGAGKPNYYVWLMQRFELAHQMKYREQNALGLLNQVRWNIRQAELTNVAATMRLYMTAAYQKEVYELTRESADLNDRLLGVVERRVESGLAPTSAVTTARVAARQSRRQADLAEATYQAAVLALRQQLYLAPDAPLSLGDRLSDYDWQPVSGYEDSTAGSAAENVSDKNSSSLALASGLVEGRPDVMAATAGIAAARGAAGLADAARTPDIQAGPIYETSDAQTKFLGFRLQMDLPVWNTGAPLARQRHAELCQQWLVREQLKRRATLEAQAAIDRYERARRLAQTAGAYDDGSGVDASADLKQILSQYEAGQADILNVFAAQNDLLRDRRTSLDLLNEVAQSAAAVVQATALPPDRLLGSGPAAGPPPAPIPLPEPAPASAPASDEQAPPAPHAP